MKSSILSTLLLVAFLAGSWLSPSAQAGAPDNDRPIRIGADQRGGGLFQGGIRAVVICGEALSPEDIAKHAKRRPEAAPEAGDAKPVYQWVASDAGASGAAKGVFSGAKDAFIEDRDAAGLSLPDDFTIEAWIRPDVDGAARIVDKILPGTADGFLLDLVNGKLRCIVGGTTVAVPLEKPANPDGWTHVAAVFDGGKLALYIAGKKCGEGGDSRDEPTVKASTAEPPASPLTLWWAHPGRGWTDAMVMGNGRLGAMQAGSVRHETFWLNEDTLWSGEPFVPTPPKDGPATLAEMRRLLIDRKDGAAHHLFDAKYLGPTNECYEPLGNLDIEAPCPDKVTDYRRELDLATGIATVRYRQDGVLHTRESFVSYPDQAIVVRLSADRPGRVNFAAGLTSPLRHAVADAGAGILRMTGRAPIHATPHYQGAYVGYDDRRGMTFAAELRAVPEGGETTIAGGRLVAKGCDAVTLVLTAGTSYNGFDKSPSRQGKDPVALSGAQGAAASKKPFAELRRRHAEDFSALMGRVSLDLGSNEAAKRPADRRLRGGYDAKDFPALTALYYQFGRYLLVSCSRPGSQPANLQGIWNRSTNPPWGSNYTMNCNANFNYLGVEAANLSELHEPFIRLVREWSVDGARTAQAWYGCRGWVGHHNCDLWRNACPSSGSASWAAFTVGGAWACRDLWEHYDFTRDKAYLGEVWPTMRGAAEFFLDFQFTDPKTGFLVTGPDVNFENADNRGGGVCMASTPSNQIIRQLFLDCIAASKVLGRDEPLRRRLETALPKIPPTVVDPVTGEIQEYLDADCRVASRRTAELLSMWGLIWSDQVTPRKTPALAAAMRKAYEAPDRRPWIHCDYPLASWCGAFPANAYARLGDGDRVGALLAKHFHEAVNRNFTGQFIQSEWQIDGNLGMMAAIGEMFLRSHDGDIELLPALPKSCAAQGSFKGLRARGGFTADCDWKDGKVVSATLRSTVGGACRVRMGDEVVTLEMKPGESRTIMP